MFKALLLSIFIFSVALSSLARVGGTHASEALSLIPANLEYTGQQQEGQFLVDLAGYVRSDASLQIYSQLVPLVFEYGPMQIEDQEFLKVLIQSLNAQQYADIMTAPLKRTLRLNMSVVEKLKFLQLADRVMNEKSITAYVVLNSISTNYGLHLKDRNIALEKFLKNELPLNDVVSVDCGTFLSRYYTRPF